MWRLKAMVWWRERLTGRETNPAPSCDRPRLITGGWIKPKTRRRHLRTTSAMGGEPKRRRITWWKYSWRFLLPAVFLCWFLRTQNVGSSRGSIFKGRLMIIQVNARGKAHSEICLCALNQHEQPERKVCIIASAYYSGFCMVKRANLIIINK